MPSVNLTDPFPGVDTTAPQVQTEKDVTISTLDNGLRVASLDNGSPLASVGVFIDAGSRYENASINGVSHFMEQMAFKSTKYRSDFKLCREMSKLGASVSASAGREHFIYSGDCLKEHVPHVVGTFSDVIQYHSFNDSEVAAQKKIFLEEVEKIGEAGEAQVMEDVQQAAYSNQTVGLSLYGNKDSVAQMSPELLREYASSFFTPGRMVVAGVGVKHDELKEHVEASFTDLPADKEDLVKAAAVYTGGDLRRHTGGPMANYAICFETAGWQDKDLVPMCVLQMLMGGGGSFSAGGPGKGMCSRLYENVLNNYGWVENASSFNAIHDDTGLFGVTGTCPAEFVGSLAEVCTHELTGMAGELPEVQIKRGKNQLKSAVLMQLEQRALHMEDIGRQVLTYGKVQSGADIAQQIDAVTAADIKRVASNMLNTAPSVAANGTLDSLQRYDVLAKSFGK